MYGIVYKMLGPKYDIDDIVQQVFIGLFESLPRFKGLSSLDTWVYRLCAKICTNHLRKKYRRRVISFVDDDKYIEVASDGVTPLSELEQQEKVEKIYEALERLSPEKQIAIVLYEMEGKTVEEISQIVRAPCGTVKSRLFHGRSELQRYLRKYVTVQ